MAVGAVLLLLLSLVSRCGLMLLIRLHSGLFGAVCVALFPPHQCALGVSCRCWLLGALFVCSCSCIVGPRSWAGCPTWSVPSGISSCCVRCYAPFPTIASLCHCILQGAEKWSCTGSSDTRNMKCGAALPHKFKCSRQRHETSSVSYTHLRAHGPY